MWRATIKGLLAHKVRLGLTALSVVLGVAFVSGTFILTDTMNKAFDDLFPTVNQGVAVVRPGEQKFKGTGPGGEQAGPGERVPASVLDGVRTVPASRRREGIAAGYAQVVGTTASPSGPAARPRSAHPGIDDPELSRHHAPGGARPPGAGQVAIDAGTASKGKITLGARIEVLLQGPPITSPSSASSGTGRAGPRTRWRSDVHRVRPGDRAGGAQGRREVRLDQGGGGEGRHARDAAGPGPGRPAPGFTATTGTQQAASDSPGREGPAEVPHDRSCWCSRGSRCSSGRSSSSTRSRSSSRSGRGSWRCSGPSGPAGAGPPVGACVEAAIVGLVASAVGLAGRVRHRHRTEGAAQGASARAAHHHDSVPAADDHRGDGRSGSVTTLVASRRAGPARLAGPAHGGAARDALPATAAAPARRTVIGVVRRWRPASRCSSSGCSAGARAAGRARRGARSSSAWPCCRRWWRGRGPGHRSRRSPGSGMSGQAGPGERHAQPAAHGLHGGRADDRPGPGGVRQHLRGVAEVLGQPDAGRDAQGRLHRVEPTSSWGSARTWRPGCRPMTASPPSRSSGPGIFGLRGAASRRSGRDHPDAGRCRERGDVVGQVSPTWPTASSSSTGDGRHRTTGTWGHGPVEFSRTGRRT